jgi:hypothetical protein
MPEKQTKTVMKDKEHKTPKIEKATKSAKRQLEETAEGSTPVSATEEQLNEKTAETCSEESREVDESAAAEKPVKKVKLHAKPTAVTTATYASVPVFEQTIRSVLLMKRKRDDKVNAAPILHLAELPKKKRAAVMKKLAMLPSAERVTVGFYKYQGLWIELDDAKRLAAAWKVDEDLNDLFDFKE